MASIVPLSKVSVCDEESDVVDPDVVDPDVVDPDVVDPDVVDPDVVDPDVVDPDVVDWLVWVFTWYETSSESLLHEIITRIENNIFKILLFILY